MFSFFLFGQKLPLPLRDGLKPLLLGLLLHLLLQVPLGLLGGLFGQHLPLPRRNHVPSVILIWNLTKNTEINNLTQNRHKKKYLLHKMRDGELLAEHRIILLLLQLLHLGPFDLQLPDARDVLRHLQLRNQIVLLRQIRVALQALQADAPRGRRKRLRRDHLVRPPQLHRVEVLDADRRQRLLLLLDGLGGHLGAGRLRYDGVRDEVFEGLRQGRRRRTHTEVLLFLFGDHQGGVVILGGAAHGRDGGALVADAPQVLGGLDEVVRVAAGEAGGHERQDPLLVHQVGEVLVFVDLGAQTNYG